MKITIQKTKIRRPDLILGQNKAKATGRISFMQGPELCPLFNRIREQPPC
jgi:hypothetical protein